MMLWYENSVEKPHWNNAGSIAFGGAPKAGPPWNPNTGSGRGPPLLSRSRSICLSSIDSSCWRCLSASRREYSIFAISKVFFA